MAKVEIYTKWGCSFCVRAKALLASKGVPFTEHDITMGGPGRDAMRARVPGAVTVPQILINDAPVGGCDEIHALDAKGQLDSLLGLAA